MHVFSVLRITLVLLAVTSWVGAIRVDSARGTGAEPLDRTIARIPSQRTLSSASPDQVLPSERRINVPYFEGEVPFERTAISWFGRVTPGENYVDVRVGYNDEELYVSLAVFDRRLWYDPAPSPEQLTAWDAATLYLALNDNAGNVPGENAFRFDSQLTWWEEPRDRWQAGYRGTGAGWAAAALPFTTEAGWRGDAPNDDVDDRGWVMDYHIPFAGLGLSAPPAQGAVWKLGIALHDRDDAAGTAVAGQTWPESLEANIPATWGQLAFGQPDYTPPAASRGGTVTIRNALDHAVVPDGMVGGGVSCGDGLDYWSAWGNANYAGSSQVNVQNQIDVSDWPCFSKYYVTFPLDLVPAGKAIISATLIMHQFGNAGQGWTPAPVASYIQVLTVGENWSEDTLTWNNAPLAMENVAGTWVEPVDPSGTSDVLRSWDVSRAAAAAYGAGEPLRLVLYSADAAYHSGRYFWSSDTVDTAQEERPTLVVTWGEPVAALRQAVRPVTATAGQAVTFTLSILGNGTALVLTDDLPAQVSAPRALEVTGGLAASYDAENHRISWSGSPGVGQAVTVTVAVSVRESGPQAVTNTATLVDAGGNRYSQGATLIIDGRRLWLGLLSR